MDAECSPAVMRKIVEPSDNDPLPEIPACLLDLLFVIPRVLEMKRTRGAQAGAASAFR